jgi:hypothetical protein
MIEQRAITNLATAGSSRWADETTRLAVSGEFNVPSRTVWKGRLNPVVDLVLSEGLRRSPARCREHLPDRAIHALGVTTKPREWVRPLALARGAPYLLPATFNGPAAAGAAVAPVTGR